MRRRALKIYTVVLALLVLVSGCKKKKSTLNTDGTPTITFESISPGSVKQFQDAITIRFSYADYDGDVGENDPNKTNLVVTDSRNGVAYKYRVKQLAPIGSSITIKGELYVRIDNTLITNGSSSENVHYTLKLEDRAGHWSNEIETSEITVTQ